MLSAEKLDVLRLENRKSKGQKCQKQPKHPAGSTKRRATPLIAEQAKKLDSFLAAIADGKVTDAELKIRNRGS